MYTPLAMFGFNEIHLCLMIFMVGGVPVSSRTSRMSDSDQKLLVETLEGWSRRWKDGAIDWHQNRVQQ